MTSRSRLGLMVVVSIILLCAGQFAFAQVDWSFDMLCVEPGPPGSWNEGRNIMGDVVFDGADYHMYLVGGPGFNPFGDPWSVGHWTWDDVNLEWDEDPAGNPVLEPGAPGAWDAGGVINIAVLYEGGSFHMWYSAPEVQGLPANVGYATDADGWGDWSKQAGQLPGLEPGAPGEWDDNGRTPSAVILDGSTYRMWFTGSSNPSNTEYMIGYATSADGLSWTKHPDPVLVGTEPFEGNRVYLPEVVPYGDGFAMWYSGYPPGGPATISFALSTNGINWVKWPDNPVLNGLPGCTVLDTFAAIIEGDTAYGWASNCYEIWELSSPIELIFFDSFETGDTTIWSAVVE